MTARLLIVHLRLPFQLLLSPVWMWGWLIAGGGWTDTREYKLLYHLVRNAGHLLRHHALLDRVWGSNYEASPSTSKCS